MSLSRNDESVLTAGPVQSVCCVLGVDVPVYRVASVCMYVVAVICDACIGGSIITS